jgi:hypothetical protein
MPKQKNTSNDVLNLVKDASNAYKMFSILENQFESITMASSVTRLDRLLDLEYKGDVDIAVHLGRINTLINQIRDAGGLELDKLHLVIILRSLPKNADWSTLVTTLKTQEADSLTKEKVNRLITERASELNDGKRSHKDKSKAAFIADRPKNICTNCKKKGHKREDCWSKGGGRERPTRFRSEKTAHYTFVLKESTFATQAGNETRNQWIVDSGASKHYTNDRTTLKGFKKIKGSLIVGNGMSIAIEGIGSITIKNRKEITLTEVYYAPKLVTSMISLSELDGKGLSTRTAKGKMIVHRGSEAVSYTHLTLPTM